MSFAGARGRRVQYFRGNLLDLPRHALPLDPHPATGAPPAAGRFDHVECSGVLHHMRDRGIRYGLQTMCEGGGTANATIVELVA